MIIVSFFFFTNKHSNMSFLKFKVMNRHKISTFSVRSWSTGITNLSDQQICKIYLTNKSVVVIPGADWLVSQNKVSASTKQTIFVLYCVYFIVVYFIVNQLYFYIMMDCLIQMTAIMKQNAYKILSASI